MPNTMRLQHHTDFIEQNELHRLKKIFSKFSSKCPFIDMKSNTFIYSEFVSFTLSNKHPMRSCRILLSFVPCLTLLHFSNYLTNDTIFRKEIIGYK